MPRTIKPRKSPPKYRPVAELLEEHATQSALIDLMAQKPIADGHVYSLDRLWRSVGCPPGKRPDEWLELSAPLVLGVAEYLRRQSILNGMPQGYIPKKGSTQEVYFSIDRNLPEGSGWKAGDTGSVWTVAYIYSRYLDGVDAKG